LAYRKIGADGLQEPFHAWFLIWKQPCQIAELVRQRASADHALKKTLQETIEREVDLRRELEDMTTKVIATPTDAALQQLETMI
jgi:hypothetical protein